MANSKGKVQVKAEVKKKAVKPKFGSGDGGLLTARIVSTVNKKKKK